MHACVHRMRHYTSRILDSPPASPQRALPNVSGHSEVSAQLISQEYSTGPVARQTSAPAGTKIDASRASRAERAIKLRELALSIVVAVIVRARTDLATASAASAATFGAWRVGTTDPTSSGQAS